MPSHNNATSPPVSPETPLRTVKEKAGPWRVARLASFPLEAALEAVRAHGAALEGGRGQAVKKTPETCVTLVEAGGRRVCVKQFLTRGIGHGLKDYARPSPARRSWKAACLLRERGIGAPLALALLTGPPWAVRRDAFLVMEELEGALPVDAFARERLGEIAPAKRRQFLSEAASFLRRLHASDIYHADLKASNLFVREGDDGFDFFLVDLAAIRRRGRTTAARRLHNLAQLHASMGKCLPWTDRLRFVRACLAGDERFGDERAVLADIFARASRRNTAWNR